MLKMKKNMYAQLSSAEEKSKISAITLGTEIVSQKYLNIFYLPYRCLNAQFK